MAAPWAETPYKVVIEFQKSSQGASRRIFLRHNASVVPPQLAGRLNPAVWHAFMIDVEQAAQQHPYVVAPSAGRVGSWLGCAAVGAVLGCCVINPDGGDYDVWLPQVRAIIDRHQAAFQAAGASLSLQRAQNSYWVQVDVNPGMAVGQPALQQPNHQQQGPYWQQQQMHSSAGGFSDQPPYKPGYEAAVGQGQPGKLGY